MLCFAGNYPRRSGPELIHADTMLHNTFWRKSLSALIVVLIFFFAATRVSQARAPGATDLPDRADVQKQLTTLTKKKELTPQDKLIEQDLSDTLQLLDKIDRVKDETALLKQQIDQAPAKMRQATDSLNALGDADSDQETRKTLNQLSMRQLEARVSDILDQLQTAQNDIATYNSQLVSLQTQPERVQNAMYNAAASANS